MLQDMKNNVAILLKRLRFERYGVKTGEKANTHNQHWLTSTRFSPSLASHPYFSSCACAEERGRGKGRKNTSGKMCTVFVPSAGMLAEPIKFEHSK